MSKARPATRAPRRARIPDGEARGAIMAATERLLAERQLHELSVTDIAEAAGTSRGIVYFYFAGKSAVLAALAETACSELVEIWRDWFDGHGPVEEAELRQNFSASVALWSEHRAIISAVVETWRLDPEVGAVWGQAMNTLIADTRARIERDRAAGHAVGAGDAGALAETLVWSSERIHYVALTGIAGSLAERPQLVEAMVQLWSRLLAP